MFERVRVPASPASPEAPLQVAPAAPRSRRRRGPRVALLAALSGATVAALLLPGERGSAGHVAAFVAALACFAALIALELRSPWLPAWPVVGVGAAMAILAVVMPPRESQDVWAYAMYGRIAVIHHANPYVVLPRHFRSDPFLSLMSTRWRRTRLVYGPGFLGVAGAVALLGRHDPTVTRLGFQIIAALCAAACVGLVWWQTRSPVATAFLALNPLVVVTVVNGGHNDALLGALILGGFLLALRRLEPWAGLVIGVAVLVKVIALLPLAGLVLWAWWHRRYLAGLAAAILGSTVTLVGYGAFRGSIRAVSRASDFVAPYTIWRLPRLVAERLAHGARKPPAWGTHLYREGLHVAIPVAATVIVLLMVLRLGRASPGPAIIAAVTGYLLAAPYALPWYAMVILPIAAVELRTKETWMALAAASLLATVYLVRRAADTGGGPAAWVGVTTTVIVAAMLTVLIALLVGPLVERRRSRGRLVAVDLPEAA